MFAAGQSLAPVGANSESVLVNPGAGKWEQAALWGWFPPCQLLDGPLARVRNPVSKKQDGWLLRNKT